MNGDTLSEADKIGRSLRYRVNVKQSTKGVLSFECTVDGQGYTQEEILEKSDLLVKALEERYSINGE